MARPNIDAIIPLLSKAIEQYGEEVTQTALRASPVHLLYEAAEMAMMAQEHVDDKTGDEEPVAPEMASHAALLALVAAAVVLDGWAFKQRPRRG